MTMMILTSSVGNINPGFLKSMEDMKVCFVIDAIAFYLFSIMSITHWRVYSEPLPCWFITLIYISATVHFVILSYHMSKNMNPFPIIEEINKKKIIITLSNQEEKEEYDEISQKTDTPVANNKCCKCSASASVTATNGEEQHEKTCRMHDNNMFIKKIVVWNLTPSLSISIMFTSPWYKSRGDITMFLLLEAFIFFLLSILQIISWVVHSETSSCWPTTFIFICMTAQFVMLSYDMIYMKYKKMIIPLSSQEEEYEDEDEDEEISQETDTPSSSSASLANDDEEHEKFEKKWMKKCVAEEFRAHESSKQLIEEMNELRNKCIEDRREWEHDRNTLLEGLSAANKSVQLYRSLLHEFDQIYTSSN